MRYHKLSCLLSIVRTKHGHFFHLSFIISDDDDVSILLSTTSHQHHLILSIIFLRCFLLFVLLLFLSRIYFFIIVCCSTTAFNTSNRERFISNLCGTTEFNLIICTFFLFRNEKLVQTEKSFFECKTKCIARCWWFAVVGS